MKKITIKNEALYEINKSTPIFVKKSGEIKILGMLVEEDYKGWIIRTGGRTACTGHFSNRKECLEQAEEFGFQFFIEDD